MTREEMEVRRLAAAAALEAGVAQAQVARHFAVSRTTTCRWDKDLRAGRSLALRPVTGRPPRVKWALIADLLRARPGGWLAERNAGESLAAAIEKAFGVRYTAEHALRTAKAVAPELFPRRRRPRSPPADAWPLLPAGATV
jgi:transposase